jgi:hypothetical protein
MGRRVCKECEVCKVSKEFKVYKAWMDRKARQDDEWFLSICS